MTHDGPSERTGPAYRWLGHGTVFLPGPPQFVIDPWRWRDVGLRADIALITHDAIDHCSPDDLREVLSAGGGIVAPRRAAELLELEYPGRVRAVTAGEELSFGDATVSVLTAEGVRRGERGVAFQARGEGVAYAVRTERGSALLLGDSMPLREHADLAPDVAFVAVGGLVTATPAEAAAACERLGARVVVPIHWGDLEARYSAAREFLTLCGRHGVNAEIARPGGTRPPDPDRG